jgi:hypothetical protein
MPMNSFTDYRAHRVDHMRRARNAAFYAVHADTHHARASFDSCKRYHVRAARLFNWRAVARLREYTQAVAARCPARDWYDTSAELR